MNHIIRHISRLFLIFSIAAVVGCSGIQNPFGRVNVTALANTQQDYFKKLAEELKRQRATFELSVEVIANADDDRRQAIVDWERDLVLVDVLLQVPGAATSRQELLLTKTAELDLESGHKVLDARALDKQRVDAILKLYDQLIAAAEKLPANNAQIVAYLSSPNPQFAINSVDISAIVRITSAVRALSDQLKGVTAKTADERKTANEKLEKQLTTARDVIVKALNLKP